MIISTSLQAQHRSNGMNADGNLLGGSNAGSGGAYIPTEGWAIAVNGGYETTLGELRDIYKAAPTFGLSLIERRNHFIFSLTADYRSFLPKQASFTFPYEVMGQTINGEIIYGNFQGVGVYAGAAYQMLITPSAGFYIGANIGSVFSKYEYVATVEPYYSETGGESKKMNYVAPKIGLNFAVANSLTLGVEARYSLKFGGTYNSRSGGSFSEGYNSVAGNLILAYSF